MTYFSKVGRVDQRDDLSDQVTQPPRANVASIYEETEEIIMKKRIRQKRVKFGSLPIWVQELLWKEVYKKAVLLFGLSRGTRKKEAFKRLMKRTLGFGVGGNLVEKGLLISLEEVWETRFKDADKAVWEELEAEMAHQLSIYLMAGDTGVSAEKFYKPWGFSIYEAVAKQAGITLHTQKYHAELYGERYPTLGTVLQQDGVQFEVRGIEEERDDWSKKKFRIWLVPKREKGEFSHHVGRRLLGFLSSLQGLEEYQTDEKGPVDPENRESSMKFYQFDHSFPHGHIKGERYFPVINLSLKTRDSQSRDLISVAQEVTAKHAGWNLAAV